MKPIKIAMSAFCPFPDLVEIDLSKFGGRGLFLISGNTGSGKTTIFDAITFALFGEASGNDRTPDTLRSDFASPDTETYVELLFTHKDKSYCIKRNPKYERPKKTGKGTTAENADATLQLPDGTFVSGHREVTGYVTELLGITYSQFKLIAMIAQGEFRKVLFADSKERAEIFRRLFGTDLFNTAQKVIKDREKDAKARCDSSIESILQYIRGIQCADDTHAEPDGDAEVATSSETNAAFVQSKLKKLINEPNIHNTEEVLNLLSAQNENDKDLEIELTEQLKLAEIESEKIISDITICEQINKLFSDLEHTKAMNADLDSRKAEIDKTERILTDAEKALYSISPLENEYLREKKDRCELAGTHTALNSKLTKLEKTRKTMLSSLEAERGKESLRSEISSAIAKLQEELPLYTTAEELDQRINSLTRELEASESIIRTYVLLKKELEREKFDISNKLNETESFEARLIECNNSVEKLRQNGRDIEKLRGEILKARKLRLEHELAENRFKSSEDKYRAESKSYAESEIAFHREQAGMLAQALQSGEPCPVCGSTEHPCKAVVTPGAPSSAMLEKLKGALESLRKKMEQDAQATSKKLAELESAEKYMSDEYREIFGEDPATDDTDKLLSYISSNNTKNINNINTLLTEIITLEKGIEDRQEWRKRRSELELAQSEAEKSYTDAIERKNTLSGEISSLMGRIETLKSSLSYESSSTAQEKLTLLGVDLKELKDALLKSEERYNSITNEVESTNALLKDSKERFERTLEKENAAYEKYTSKIISCGLNSEVEYREALLEDSYISSKKKELQEYRSLKNSVNADLRRLEKETAGKSPQDLSALKEKKLELDEKKRSIEALLRSVTARCLSNTRTEAAIIDENERRIVFEAEYVLISMLSKSANGELIGKQKLTFEQYVQAYYFNRILDVANRRLAQMSGNRYVLIRKEVADNIRSQSGLDINVLDNYTGKPRPVKSLSGGESFLASLSLALGLSDVIESHAGGVEIEMMFIDEGFGSLDPQATESAVRTLNSLASGDRIIGVISHVPELKERIENQIVLTKGINGSTVKTGDIQ